MAGSNGEISLVFIRLSDNNLLYVDVLFLDKRKLSTVYLSI